MAKQDLIAGAIKNVRKTGKTVQVTYLACTYPNGEDARGCHVDIDPFTGHGNPSDAILAALAAWPKARRDMTEELEAYRQEITSPEYIAEKLQSRKALLLHKQEVRLLEIKNEWSTETAEKWLKKKAAEAREAAKAAKKAKASAESDAAFEE